MQTPVDFRWKELLLIHEISYLYEEGNLFFLCCMEIQHDSLVLNSASKTAIFGLIWGNAIRWYHPFLVWKNVEGNNAETATITEKSAGIKRKIHHCLQGEWYGTFYMEIWILIWCFIQEKNCTRSQKCYQNVGKTKSSFGTEVKSWSFRTLLQAMSVSSLTPIVGKKQVVRQYMQPQSPVVYSQTSDHITVVVFNVLMQ